jgi:hypothetical protein
MTHHFIATEKRLSFSRVKRSRNGTNHPFQTRHKRTDIALRQEMGKTSGSRKAKVFKNNKKLEEILEVEAISADMEFVEEYAMGKGPRKKIREGAIDDKIDDEIGEEIVVQEKVKTAKVVEDVIKDVVQDDVEMFHQETISKAQDEQKKAESNRIHVPLSPKSTLLAFRREAPAEEDLPMQSSTIVPEIQP